MIKIIPLAPFFFFLHSFIRAPLSLIHSHLISDSEAHLSQFTLSTPMIKLWSLNSLSQLPSKLDVTNPPVVPSHRSTSDPRCHSPQTHVTDQSACLWLCLLLDIGYLTGKPMELADPPFLPTHPFCRPSSPTLCLFVIGDFLFCL